MDTGMSPSVKVKRDSRGFPAVLASAVHEWLLIFLLFVNAVFSYFLTKFARSSKLQTPCLLCSRLDNVLGNEEPGFYKNLICGAHKLELSSLVYCCIHDKLANVHEMCECCLFSFAIDKKSNPETYRFLVGKLGTDLESYFYQDPSLKQSSSEKQCSCCNETWTPRSYDQRLLQSKSIWSESSVGHSRVNHSDGLKKRNKKRSGQLTTSYLRSRSFEALSHIGYSELKITSESESEILFSDEGDISTMAQDGDDFKEDFVAHCVQPVFGTTTSPTLLKNIDELAPEKLISHAASSVLPVQVPTVKIDADEPNYLAPSASTVAFGLGLAPKKRIPRASSPLLSVPVPNEQIDVGEPDDLTPPAATAAFCHGLASENLSPQSSSPGLSVLVPTEQIEVGEPDYSTPPTSTVASGHGLAPEKEISQASPPLLSVLVPNEQIDIGEPDYLTPPTSTVASGYGLVLEKQISQVFSPALSVLVPNEQIYLGEPDYLTPTSTVALGHGLATENPNLQASSPGLSVLVPNEQIDVGDPDYLTPPTFSVASGHILSPEMQVLASSPALSIQVPTEKIDVGEPDYLTPSADTVTFGHVLASEKLSSQASSPGLPVPDPNERIDEPNYFTPPASTDVIDHGLSPGMQISQASLPVLSVLVPNEQIDVGELDYLTPLASADAIGHGLKELNWHQMDPPAPPELMSLDDVPFLIKTAEVFVEAPGEPLDTTRTGDLDQTVTTETGKNFKLESDSLTTTGSCSKMDQVVRVSGETLDAAETGGTGQTSGTESEEIPKLESGLTTTSGPGLNIDQELNDGKAPFPNSADLAGSLKVVVVKGSQVSNILAEQLAAEDSTRVSEDLKLLLSQAARGLDSSSNEMSPRAHFHGDDLKIFDATSSKGMPKRISIERNESGVESLDGSIVSEIEGESVVDRLKRQDEHDWKSMSALYKELEEERNASAIAANQAMAMITRLQEEKAALHMEALQYLRMMEEQAEYDVEALQKANDLLAEREKEMQDLEAELEIYRRKYPDESIVDEIQDSWFDVNGGDVEVEHSDVSCTNLPNNSLVSKKSEDGNKSEKIDLRYGDKYTNIVKDSLSNFEDERSYISQCLKKLEKQLHLFSNNGICVNTSNGGYSGKECHGLNGQEQHQCNEATQQNGTMEEHESSMQKDSYLSREGHSAQETCASPVGNHQLQNKENHYSDSDEQDNSADRGINLVALENEVSDLNERLEALEADRSFLEHTINALQNGDEGIQFVREIANHLQELRRIGMKSI